MIRKTNLPLNLECISLMAVQFRALLELLKIPKTNGPQQS